MNKTHSKMMQLLPGFVAVAYLLTAAAVMSVAASPAAAEQKKPVIYTVNYPLYYFATRIAGDDAEVVFPAPPGEDPAFWMPDAEVIAQYQKADLILLNGAGYAKWIAKATVSKYRMVDTSARFKDRYIETRGSTTHRHGPGGEHSHAGIAFTTWLDPMQAAAQAEAVYEALLKKLPDMEKELKKRFQLLKRDLVGLDGDIEQIVAGRQGQPFIASHPVYQYLARRYGINLESVMWEPGEYPTEELWSQLEYGLQSHLAKWMIWEGEPLEKSSVRLESIGVGSIVFDPCGNRPGKGDYLTVMKSNIKNLKKIYE